ncbi:MAG: efflux RND transporter periplasmic adaptor subunit [Beggiatoa sp.]|nr:efflux RND transporter periplasmic adaptor subunit [Beggiatoa sp.]
MKTQHLNTSFRTPPRVRGLVPSLLLLTLVAGCVNEPATQTIARPVRVVRVGGQPEAGFIRYAGEVQARYETRLSFRVAGKVIARHVEVGARVRKGQLIAEIDPTDYRLAVQGLTAQLTAAAAERDFARDDVKRYQALLEQKFISPAEYDRRETLYKTARDRVKALEAQLRQARNQIGYTRLTTDRPGVITAREVEAGQVVSAGQPIVTVAELGDKEVVIAIPESRIAGARAGEEVEVELWADGGRRFKGRTREIAPSADPASRTYRVKITLLEGQDVAQLGMTATVYVVAPGTHELAIPLAAVFSPQNERDLARVWVVDEATSTVRSLPVELGAPLNDERIVTAGLSAGQLIVTAGVTRLIEGQAVQLIEEAAGIAMQGGKRQEIPSIGPRLIAGELP